MIEQQGWLFDGLEEAKCYCCHKMTLTDTHELTDGEEVLICESCAKDLKLK